MTSNDLSCSNCTHMGCAECPIGQANEWDPATDYCSYFEHIETKRGVMTTLRAKWWMVKGESVPNCAKCRWLEIDAGLNDCAMCMAQGRKLTEVVYGTDECRGLYEHRVETHPRNEPVYAYRCGNCASVYEAPHIPFAAGCPSCGGIVKKLSDLPETIGGVSMEDNP
jgi:hypothetical protein